MFSLYSRSSVLVNNDRIYFIVCRHEINLADKSTKYVTDWLDWKEKIRGIWDPVYKRTTSEKYEMPTLVWYWFNSLCSFVYSPRALSALDSVYQLINQLIKRIGNYTKKKVCAHARLMNKSLCIKFCLFVSSDSVL